MATCAACGNKTNRYEETLQCTGPCKSVYHIDCINISSSLLTEMRINGDANKWVCRTCKKQTSAPIKTVGPGKLSLEDIMETLKAMRSENTQLKKCLDELHVKLDSHSTLLNDLLLKTQKLEEENTVLKTENNTLRLTIDAQEQYSRRNCLEIHGVPESAGENTVAEVIKIGRALGVEVTTGMIDNCHRLGKKGKIGGADAIRGILVNFIRNTDKQALLNARKVKKDLNTSNLGLNVSNTIYINENLTAYRRSLLSNIRKLKKTCKLAYVWTRNGNIYLRERENSPIVTIRTEDDIVKVEARCKDLAREILDNTTNNV